MTTTIRASTYTDLIATVHMRLGFVPTESLVVIGMNGRRVGVVGRVDLSGLEDVLPMLVETLEDPRKGNADAVQVLVFTADNSPAAARLPIGLVKAALTVPVRTELVVGAAHYRTLDEDHWHSLDGIKESVVSAHHVYAGGAVAASREEILPTYADEHGRAVARRAAAAGKPFLNVVEAWWQAREGKLPPTRLGRLAKSIEDREMRDAILVLLVTNDLDQGLAVAGGGAACDEAAGKAMASMMDQRVGVAPDGDVVRSWLTVLGQVASATAGTPASAGPWTLYSILAWWLGDGATASQAMERALKVDPEYRLARLMHDCLSAGIPPAWYHKR